MSCEAVGMSTSPLRSLGLPDPSELSFQDPELARAYAEFCSGLSFVREGMVIKARYKNKDGTWEDGFTAQIEWRQIDLTRLRLIAALYHPNDKQIDMVHKRMYEIDTFVAETSQRNYTHPYSINNARLFNEFRNTVKVPSNDVKQIVVCTVPAETLVRLVICLSSAPGVTYWNTFDASAFNEEWAMVLRFPDAEDLQENMFPEIAGFVTRQHLHRGMALLLAEIERYHFRGEPAEVCEVVGCTKMQTELLVMSVTDHYSHLDRDWDEGFNASWVLQRIEELREELTDEGLQLAYKQFGSLCGFLKVLDEIISLDGDLAEDRERREVVWFDREILRALIRKYGSPDRLGYFKKIHRKLLRDLEEWKRAEEEMEELFKAAVKRAAPVFSPDDLPADINMGQHLTEFQVLGLTKWISTLPGVKEVINFQKRSFRGWGHSTDILELEFVDERGQRRTVQVKVVDRRWFPLRDAFQQLLSQLEDQNPKKS
jgi:hypothetical protein